MHMIHSWAMVPTGFTPYFLARYTLEVPTKVERKTSKLSRLENRLMAYSCTSAQRRLRRPNSENTGSQYWPIWSISTLASVRRLASATSLS